VDFSMRDGRGEEVIVMLAIRSPQANSYHCIH